MIRSFADRDTEELFLNRRLAKLPQQLAKKAGKALDRVDRAQRIEDLYFPPGNRLHRLHGHEPPRYAIRVDRQHRITFEWSGADADNVRFEDYHD